MSICVGFPFSLLDIYNDYFKDITNDEKVVAIVVTNAYCEKLP